MVEDRTGDTLSHRSHLPRRDWEALGEGEAGGHHCLWSDAFSMLYPV